jgi:hypothetical protein
MFPRATPTRWMPPDEDYRWVGGTTVVRVPRARMSRSSFLESPFVAAQGAGDPSTATLVTSNEEDRYIHDVQRSAQALSAQVPQRLRVSWPTYLGELAKNDPYWTAERQQQHDLVLDYEIWALELDLHVKEWDSRSILDKAGRFAVAGLPGVFLVNDWAAKTSGFDKQLHEWANRLVQAGVVDADKVPEDIIHRPQSVWASDDGAPEFGVTATATKILKPVLWAGVLAAGVLIAVKFGPGWMAARAARSRAA